VLLLQGGERLNKLVDRVTPGLLLRCRKLPATWFR